MEPDFLRLDDVLRIHADQIERYGGSHGVRDPGLLSSAVDMPRAGFGGEYMHPTLFDMAAAYLFHIVQNHPFIDGNKRAGTAAALVFLDMNGVEVEITDEALVDHVLAVAQGLMDKPAIAEFLRAHVVE